LWKLFSKNSTTWEFIFEKTGLFKISENKNLSKINSYTAFIGNANIKILVINLLPS